MKNPIQFYLASYGLGDVSLWTLGNPRPTKSIHLDATAYGIARERRGPIFVANNLIGPGRQFVAKFDAFLAQELARYEGSEWEGLTHLTVYRDRLYMATSNGILEFSKKLTKPKILGPKGLSASSFTKHAGRLYFAGHTGSNTHTLNSIWSLSTFAGVPRVAERAKFGDEFSPRSLAFATGRIYVSGYRDVLSNAKPVLRTYASNFKEPYIEERYIDGGFSAPFILLGPDGEIYGTDLVDQVRGITVFGRLKLMKTKVSIEIILRNGNPHFSGNCGVCFVKR